MNPRGSLQWSAHEVGVGTLYLPPQLEAQNAAVAELLQRPDATGLLLGKGNKGGRVYMPASPCPLPGSAIKEFTYRSLDGDLCGDLQELRANVMVGEGLNKLAQKRGSWKIRGLHILGALVVHDAADFGGVYARWVMEEVKPPSVGIQSSRFLPEYNMSNKRAALLGRSAMPDLKRRERLYDNALRAANDGRPPKVRIEPDDHCRNLLLESIPVVSGRCILRQGVAVKIDVMADAGFDF